MKLPALTPSSWGDLVLNFERLQSWLTTTGDRASGTGTLTWPGAQRTSTPLTVTHGLGTTPTKILFGSGTSNVYVAYSNVTTTTFDATGNTLDGTSPAAGTQRAFSWEAIA